jgi:hypothetical protein
MEAQIALDNCYDEPVSLDDLTTYISQLLPLFNDKNEATLRVAARDAFLQASGGAELSTFQRVALPVITAIASNLSAKAHCPEEELNVWYAPYPTTWTCP